MLATSSWGTGGSTAYAFVQKRGRLRSAMFDGELYDEDEPTLAKKDLTRALAESIAPEAPSPKAAAPKAPATEAPARDPRQAPTARPAQAHVDDRSDWRLVVMGAALAIMTGISSGLAAFLVQGLPSCPLLRDTRAAEIVEGRSFAQIGAARIAPQPAAPRSTFVKPKVVAPRESGIIRQAPF